MAVYDSILSVEDFTLGDLIHCWQHRPGLDDYHPLKELLSTCMNGQRHEGELGLRTYLTTLVKGDHEMVHHVKGTSCALDRHGMVSHTNDVQGYHRRASEGHW